MSCDESLFDVVMVDQSAKSCCHAERGEGEVSEDSSWLRSRIGGGPRAGSRSLALIVSHPLSTRSQQATRARVDRSGVRHPQQRVEIHSAGLRSTRREESSRREQERPATRSRHDGRRLLVLRGDRVCSALRSFSSGCVGGGEEASAQTARLPPIILLRGTSAIQPHNTAKSMLMNFSYRWGLVWH